MVYILSYQFASSVPSEGPGAQRLDDEWGHTATHIGSQAPFTHQTNVKNLCGIIHKIWSGKENIK